MDERNPRIILAILTVCSLILVAISFPVRPLMGVYMDGVAFDALQNALTAPQREEIWRAVTGAIGFFWLLLIVTNLAWIVAMWWLHWPSRTKS